MVTGAVGAAAEVEVVVEVVAVVVVVVADPPVEATYPQPRKYRESWDYSPANNPREPSECRPASPAGSVAL